MGNRAVITMDKKPTQSSVGIYLHWNGGPESVLAFAEAAKHFGIRFGDDSYAVARLSQIIGNYFGGTVSIGIGTLRRLDCHNYDNGTYKVMLDGDQIALEQSPDGKTGWQRLDNDDIRRHQYWQVTEDSAGILADVIEANKMAFAGEAAQ
jgi:hypothetical protein